MRELIEYIVGLTRADFVEVRIGEKAETDILVQDGKADKLRASVDRGACVRVLLKGAWGFSATTEVKKESLEKCLREAISLAEISRRGVKNPLFLERIRPVVDRVGVRMEKDPRKVSVSEKMGRLLLLEKAARDYSRYIVNTVLRYHDGFSREIVGNSFGTYLEKEEVRIGLGIQVTSYRRGERQSSRHSQAKLGGFELVENLTPEDFSIIPARRAVELLKAKLPPAGQFTVILSPQVSGIFAHEAFGHNAEADEVWSGQSLLAGRVGKRIGSELVTIIDDSTIPGAYGSYKYDSEGTPGERRILLENGVLKGFMHSLETAARFGVSPNGSARAENYNYPPLVRMSNTFICPGEKNLEEVISEVKEGILLEEVGHGGYVFPERGQFMFNSNYSFSIKNGRRKELLRNVSISGLTLETLREIDAVSREFSFSNWDALCGKGGQRMYVDGGGPYVRVKKMVVGGFTRS